MSRSLISAKQLSPDVSGIVGTYGSGYFLPISFSGESLTSDNFYSSLNLTGVSGISATIGELNNRSGIIIAFTGTQIDDSKYLQVTGNSIISGENISSENINIIGYANDSGYLNLSGELSVSGRADIYGNLNITGNVSISNRLTVSGNRVITSAETGLFYDVRNPNGFITSNAFANFMAQTGCFITDSMTGDFYSSQNPSGFIGSGALSSYALKDNVYSGLSGVTQIAIGYSKLRESSSKIELSFPTGSYVQDEITITTGGKIILESSGLQGKTAYFQPIPVQISGETKTILVLCTDPF